ncbi:unnamed protein product [Heterosigma akashiwo]
MPALRFLGRKWKVGGDEFVLPAILTVLLRLCWVLGLVFWASSSCPPPWHLHAAAVGAICYSRTAPWMLFAQLAIALLVFSQLLDLGVTTCCCLVFRGRPEGEEGGGEGEGRGRLVSFDAQHGELVALQWQRRCQKMCSFATCVTCKIFGRAGEQNDFSQVARVMATVFNTEGHLDLVASDLLAGLVLLRHVQRRRDQDRRTALGLTRAGKGPPLPASFYKVADKKILSMNNPSEREVLDEFSYYSKYMLGVYSWPLLVFMDPLCGGCRLCPGACEAVLGGSKVHRHRRMTYENLGLGGGAAGGGAPRWGPPGTGGVRGDESCMNANEGALLALSGLADPGTWRLRRPPTAWRAPPPTPSSWTTGAGRWCWRCGARCPWRTASRTPWPSPGPSTTSGSSNRRRGQFAPGGILDPGAVGPLGTCRAIGSSTSC